MQGWSHSSEMPPPAANSPHGLLSTTPHSPSEQDGRSISEKQMRGSATPHDHSRSWDNLGGGAALAFGQGQGVQGMVLGVDHGQGVLDQGGEGGQGMNSAQGQRDQSQGQGQRQGGQGQVRLFLPCHTKSDGGLSPTGNISPRASGGMEFQQGAAHHSNSGQLFPQCASGATPAMHNIQGGPLSVPSALLRPLPLQGLLLA